MLCPSPFGKKMSFALCGSLGRIGVARPAHRHYRLSIIARKSDLFSPHRELPQRDYADLISLEDFSGGFRL